jgi:hypothetical protein
MIPEGNYSTTCWKSDHRNLAYSFSYKKLSLHLYSILFEISTNNYRLLLKGSFWK